MVLMACVTLLFPLSESPCLLESPHAFKCDLCEIICGAWSLTDIFVLSALKFMKQKKKKVAD